VSVRLVLGETTVGEFPHMAAAEAYATGLSGVISERFTFEQERDAGGRFGSGGGGSSAADFRTPEHHEGMADKHGAASRAASKAGDKQGAASHSAAEKAHLAAANAHVDGAKAAAGKSDAANAMSRKLGMGLGET
jgi:hypothetical protein